MLQDKMPNIYTENCVNRNGKKATFTVKPEFADFENTVFTSLGDGEKCKETSKEICHNFSFDFNNPKFKKHTKITTDAVCNGFKVKKQNHSVPVASMAVLKVVEVEVAKFLPKTMDVQS